MAQQNRFMIRNDLSKPLTLNIEPEGAFFPLAKGEEVSVVEVFTTAPVTVNWPNTSTRAPASTDSVPTRVLPVIAIVPP